MADLDELAVNLDLEFKDRILFQQAFVHRSYLNENPDFPLASNERLEFLGDAVIGFVVAEYLYRQYPDLAEGELTNLRSAVVRTRTLAGWALGLGLDQHLFLGRGEESSGGRARQATLAGTFEALTAAVFLDSGLDNAREFLVKLLESEMEHILRERLHLDYKSLFQELAQRKHRSTPVYRTVASRGPDHDKRFSVEVLVDGRSVATGEGRSKQEAQQAAAKAALEAENAPDPSAPGEAK